MTTADKEVPLSVPAEPQVVKKSPKTGAVATEVLLALIMMAAASGLVYGKKRA